MTSREQANQRPYLEYLRGRGYRGRKVIRADGRPTDTFKKFVKSIGGRLRLPQDFVYVNRATRNLVDTRTTSVRWVREYRRGLRNARFNRNVERKQAVNRRNSGLTYHKFEDILGVVRGTTAMNSNAPFQLVLTSATTGLNNAGLHEFFTFNNFYHFQKWFQDILTNGVSGSDGQNSFTFDRNMWEWVAVEIRAIAGGCNKHTKTERKITCYYNTYECYNPVSMLNNCGIKCVEHFAGTKLDCKKIRTYFELERDTMISITQLLEIYKLYTKNDKPLIIVDENYDEELVFDAYNYILLYQEHYYCVVGAQLNSIINDASTNRGTIIWDFETHPTDEYVMVGNTKSYILKPTICHGHYTNYQSKETVFFAFTTDRNKTCGRKFLDWLLHQNRDRHFYNLVAHNGSRFDHYFLMNDMTEQETLNTRFQLRGHSVIGIQYSSNLFKDSCCFLPDTLKNLSKSYRIDDSKQTSFDLHGETITNEQLCFYKPELGFWEFMDLEKSDPEFWELYNEYCKYDCISLGQIWKKFKSETNKLIEKMRTNLLKKCSVDSCNTIGSLAKKIVDTLNQKNPFYHRYREFVGDDLKKYEFVCKFKRGGISHSHQMGRHDHSITSMDIVSEYSAACIHMQIPTGRSFWVDRYEEKFHGFYEINNMVWGENTKRFKPVAGVKESGVLDWNNVGQTLYVDSFMLKYLMEHYDLLSFNVVRGLVSTQCVCGDKLFGKYVDVLGTEKKRQDQLKKDGDIEYNQAYREVIKLFLNSLTGKLVENTSEHFKLKRSTEGKLSINGVSFEKEKDGKMNPWVVAGVMVYSYSKRLLFEYIRCLPNDSDDAIVVETDSIYFDTRVLEIFYENVRNYVGDYPIAIGDEFGNMKQEIQTTGTSYTLGKKFSCFHVGCQGKCKESGTECDSLCQNKFTIKGIPKKTIDDHGRTIHLVDVSLYEDVYAGKDDVKRTFATMQKTLFGNTTISAHRQTRHISQQGVYQLYT